MRQSTQPPAPTRFRTAADRGQLLLNSLAKRGRLGLALTLIAGLMPMAATAKETDPAKQVSVLGRTWVVAPADKAPGFYRATRLNTELLPKRPPAVLTVRQALRAFQGATGCSANRDTLYRDISGSYFATLICPRD